MADAGMDNMITVMMIVIMMVMVMLVIMKRAMRMAVMMMRATMTTKRRAVTCDTFRLYFSKSPHGRHLGDYRGGRGGRII